MQADADTLLKKLQMAGNSAAADLMQSAQAIAGEVQHGANIEKETAVQADLGESAGALSQDFTDIEIVKEAESITKAMIAATEKSLEKTMAMSGLLDQVMV